MNIVLYAIKTTMDGNAWRIVSQETIDLVITPVPVMVRASACLGGLETSVQKVGGWTILGIRSNANAWSSNEWQLLEH
jgi:hypothetical protein